MIANNRLWNSFSSAQGDATKALVVCSAGLLRSPTIANILARDPYNFNCRAVGCDRAYALIPIDGVLVSWADIVIFVDKDSENTSLSFLGDYFEDKTTICLDIGDNYEYNNPILIELAKNKLKDTLTRVGFDFNTGKFE